MEGFKLERYCWNKYGVNNSVTTRTVDTHIKRLRSKIGEVGSKIETVRGVGYRFNYVV